MSEHTGGSAFPSVIYRGASIEWDKGMTLREYFAAKAMQGLCANGNRNAQDIARAAYIIADAMLKARQE